MGRYKEIRQETAEVVGFRVVKHRNTWKAHAVIRDLIVQHGSLSYKEIAEMLGVSRWLVYKVAVEFGVRRPRGAGSPARRKLEPEAKADGTDTAVATHLSDGGSICQDAEN